MQITHTTIFHFSEPFVRVLLFFSSTDLFIYNVNATRNQIFIIYSFEPRNALMFYFFLHSFHSSSSSFVFFSSLFVSIFSGKRNKYLLNAMNKNRHKIELTVDMIQKNKLKKNCINGDIKQNTHSKRQTIAVDHAHAVTNQRI